MSIVRKALNTLAFPWSDGRWLRRPGTDRMTPRIPDIRQKLIDAPIPVDADGSPVTLEPNCWYVCFVPGLKRQWWHPFAHRLHKHVFVIRPDGEGRWLLIESWWNRILAATLTAEQAERFLRWGARGSILLVREYVPGKSSQVRGWMTCAALVAHHLGRSYWVWTPHQLYRALRKEEETVEVGRAGFTASRVRPEDLGAALHRLARNFCSQGHSVLGCVHCHRTGRLN